MKIAFFTENYRRGGLDTFLISLINNWPETNDELVLICNKTHPGLKTIISSINRQLEIVEHEIFTHKVASDWGGLKRCPRFIRGAVLLFLMVILFPYLVFQIKKILQKTDPNRLLVINGGYPAGETCLSATIAWGTFKEKPKSWHNFHNYAQKSYPFMRLRGYIIDSIVGKMCAGLVTVSKGCADSLSNRPALKNIQVKVIFNGIEYPKIIKVTDLRKELLLNPEDPICLMLATYEPRKGHEFIFKAFKLVNESMPTANLVIFGDRTEAEYAVVEALRQTIAPKANIHLLGFRNDATNLINQSNVLVVPSQSFESFGLTSVEAMALGVPVVATDVGGIPEVVKNGDGGFCVDRNDHQLFASRIIELLVNKQLVEEQGLKGKERFRKHFLSERMSHQYSALVRGT